MAEDVASLVLEVDSTPVKRATDDLDKLIRKGKQTEDQLGKEAIAHDKVAKASERANRARDDKGRFVGASGARTASINAENNALLGMLTTFKKLAIGTSIGTAIGFTLREIYQNTAEAEKVQAQLAARIQSTGGAAGLALPELNRMAKELQSVSTYGDEAIGSAQAMLLTFTKVGRETFPQAMEAILDVSTALEQDLNTSAKMVGKALNDPVKGMNTLTRAGVQFSTEQKAVVKALVKTGDMAGAQKIILGELETQMGGSARAARNTLGGAFTALKEAAGDLMEGEGGSLEGVKDNLNDLIGTMQDPSTKEAFASLTSAVLTLTGVVIEGATEFAEFGRIIGYTMASITGDLSKMDEVDESIREVDRAMKNSFMGKPTKYLFTSEAELKQIKAQLVAERDALLVAQGGKAQGDTTARKPPGEAKTGKGGMTEDEIEAAAAAAAAEEERAKEAERAAKAAEKLAEQKREQRARDLENLRQSLRTEEEDIEASYQERAKIIADTTVKGSDEEKMLTQRSKDRRQEEVDALRESKNSEIEELRLSLRTEEEELDESLARRLEIIDKNTTQSEDYKERLREKVREDHAKEIEELREAEREKAMTIAEGYMTQEEQMVAWHERRKQEILKATYLTEKARQELLKREEEAFAADQAARQQAKIQEGLAATSNFLGSMAQLMAVYGKASDKDAKKRWKMSQNFALASAVVSTAAGVAKALEKGFPVGWIEAAAAAAAGAAQIVTIKSQTYSGNYDLGGHIPAGKWGWVGERGPERVRGPLQVEARKTGERHMGEGGGAVTVNMPISIDNGGNATTPGASVTQSGARTDAEQAKELGNVVSAKVREELAVQQKQGGILWRMQHG